MDRARKTCWDCVKNDMEGFGLSQKDAHHRNKWKRKIKGQPASQSLPGEIAVKTVFVCLDTVTFSYLHDPVLTRKTREEFFLNFYLQSLRNCGYTFSKLTRKDITPCPQNVGQMFYYNVTNC